MNPSHPTTQPEQTLDVCDSQPDLQPQTWAEIDLEALTRNFERVAACLGAKAPLILSVKKEAYGHGLIPVVRRLHGHPRCAAVGVATIDEALALRQAGIESPIMMFSVLHGDALRAAIENGLWLTATCPEEIREISDSASVGNRTMSLHYKIDTGMGRLGRFADETVAGLAEIRSVPNVELAGVYTHLPDGWREPEETKRQLRETENFVRAAGLQRPCIHLGGSDGLSAAGDPALGALRAGIAVYGYHPAISDLEPVMHFKTRIIYRRSGRKGMPISYKGLHRLERDAELAVIGAGYGNGFPVALSNKASVLIGGRRCPVLGRICMDQTVVDVSGVAAASCGDEVVLFGRQQDQVLGADELAELAHTISYELLCCAGQINPRFYQPAKASPPSNERNPSR